MNTHSAGPVVDTYFVNVAGVSFRQDAVATAIVGDICNLVHEPENPVDQNAIKVVLGKNNMVLGYIPKDQNTVFLEALAAGFVLQTAVSMATLATDYETIWIQLRVEATAPAA